MKQAHKVTTRFPIESDLEADNIERLSDLINEVYDDAESSMWKRKGTRTNPAEVLGLTNAPAMQPHNRALQRTLTRHACERC